MVALATVTGTTGATGVTAAKDITETSDNKIFTKRFILILQSSLLASLSVVRDQVPALPCVQLFP
jgi:hypothetical protein